MSGPLRLLAAGEIRNNEPKLVREIRAVLPEGWECKFEPGQSTQYVPTFLSRPAFTVAISHPAIVIDTSQHPARGPLEPHRIIPLCFYRIGEKRPVFDAIARSSLLSSSSSIPVYFGETGD